MLNATLDVSPWKAQVWVFISTELITPCHLSQLRSPQLLPSEKMPWQTPVFLGKAHFRRWAVLSPSLASLLSPAHSCQDSWSKAPASQLTLFSNLCHSGGLLKHNCSWHSLATNSPSTQLSRWSSDYSAQHPKPHKTLATVQAPTMSALIVLYLFKLSKLHTYAGWSYYILL